MGANQDAPDWQEEMQKARERLRRAREQSSEITDPATPVAEAPALQSPGQTLANPDFPPIDAGTPPVEEQRSLTELPPRDWAADNPRGALAVAKTRLSDAQEARGKMREDQKSWFTDAKTTGKIALLYPIAGALGRGESEMQLRELTKNLVWDRLEEDDQVAIESLAGKKIKDMKWQDLQTAGRKHYGSTLATRRASRDDPALTQKKRNLWDEKMRSMMGYREGDWNDPSGSAHFPMGRELIGGSIQSSTLSFYEHFIRPVFSKDTPELAEEMVEAVRLAADNYRLGTKKSVDKTMFAEEAIWYNPLTYFNEETKDPYHDLTGFMHTMGQQMGNLGAMIIAARLGGRVGARSYTKSLMKPGMATERIQQMQKTGARFGGGYAGGKAEMALIRDGVFSEVNERIQRDLPDEVWEAHAPYQRLVADEGMTPEEAKQVIAYTHANNAGEMAMVISGAMMGTPMGVLYGSRTGVSAGRQLAKESLAKQMGKGFAYETGQEMSQELSEAIIGNLGVRNIDPDQDLWEGGLEAVGTAFFISGVPGAFGGIHGEKGAAIARDRDNLIRKAQPWVNAMNERWKFQNKIGPNTSWAKDASPQEQLKAMIELERLQKKEAEAFMNIRGEARVLLEQTGVDNEKLLEFDAQSAGYETSLSFIKKQQKRRTNSRKRALEEKTAQRERHEATQQVQREVRSISENMRLVENMTTVQRGELLQEEEYDELVKLGYGTYTGKGDSGFALTKRGIRGMQELASQASELRAKVESGYIGPNRREDSKLREEMAGLTDEEFEKEVMVDPTTKLWNKRKWYEDEEANKGKAHAVLDADSLGWVNDNMSHSAGTEYLQKISRELQAAGTGINAYRYGGDEFILTGPDAGELQSAVESAISRINDAAPVEEGGQSVRVTLSVGYGADFDAADAALKEEKQRRIDTGERMDKYRKGAVPPSFRVSGEEAGNPKQMALFSISKNYDMFDDDKLDNSIYNTDDWEEYIRHSDYNYNRALANVTPVEEEHMEWVFEVVDDFLPSDNNNNPPVSVLHDAEWLRELAPRQYKEITDMPFGAFYTRGLFSLDDPTHGVFLLADVIISEAKSQLRMGHRISEWRTGRHALREGDQIEIISDDGSIEMGIVEQVDTADYTPVVTSASERRLNKAAIAQRKAVNRLHARQKTQLAQIAKMRSDKRANRNHPMHKKLSDILDKLGIASLEMNRIQSQLLQERNKKYVWTHTDTSKDKVYVALESDGTMMVFDPNSNKVIPAAGQKDIPVVHMGRARHTLAGKVSQFMTAWHTNYGNLVQAENEKLTKEMVQEIAADTLMHETIGHYGIRGITKDWKNYINLTHALVDAFPELVAGLRAKGYLYRDDFEGRGDQLNAQNKALLGEEVMAHVAGDQFGKLDMRGMTLPQQTAVQRFLSWFKLQLIGLGFNRLYRRRQAKQIRSARRKLYKAKTDQERMAAKKALDALINVTDSGVRTGKWTKGHKQPVGVVVRAASGFLNDQDLLNILARSHDFIRNGKRRWKFTGHDGKRHMLPMRDTEMFRRPVYSSMADGTRSRTEEEIITEEDRAPAPPVPTLKEAYKIVTGRRMPMGWKPLTPGDFKDEAKEMMKQKSGPLYDEYIAAKEAAEAKDEKLGPPVFLHQRATAGQADDVAGQVQSIISKAKKEQARKEKALRSKQAKIELIERFWGKDLVAKDQIPIFPEIASIQGFIDAVKHALPSAKNKGYITPMEVEASGIMEAIWPSRTKALTLSWLSNDPQRTKFFEHTGITEERLEEMAQPASRITTKEAQSISDWMQQQNKEANDVGSGDIFSPRQMDVGLLEQNNALTFQHFVDVMGQYGLSNHQPQATTLALLLGEEHQMVQDFEQAQANLTSGDPDLIRAAKDRMKAIMDSPIDVQSIDTTKEWVMKRIEKPSFHVEAMAARQVAEKWQNHYKRITGEDPDPAWGDDTQITDEKVRAEVLREIQKDLVEGPDIGYDSRLGVWVTVPAHYEVENYLNTLMTVYAIPDSYKIHVFYQTPEGPVKSAHNDYAYNRGIERGTRGQFAHTRTADAFDGDPNAPKAPNPDKQGRMFINFEHQSDWAQDALAKYRTQEEYEAAERSYSLDTLALQNQYTVYNQQIASMFIDTYEKELNKSSIGDDVDHQLVSYFGQEVIDKMDDLDLKIARHQLQMNMIAANNYDVFTNITSAMGQMRTDLMKRISRLHETTIIPDVPTAGQPPANVAFSGDARMFDALDASAMNTILFKQKNLVTVIQQMANDYRVPYGSDSWKKLRDNGGIVALMRKGTLSGKAQSEAGKSLFRQINSIVSRTGLAESGNQPGHRLPFMPGQVKDTMTELAKVMGWEPADGSSVDAAIDSMMEQQAQQSLMQMIIPYEDWSDLGAVDKASVNNAIHNWLDGSPDIQTPKKITTRDGIITIDFIGTPSELDSMKGGLEQSLKNHLAVQLDEGDISAIETKILNLNKMLGKEWHRLRGTDINNWKEDFNIQLASVKIQNDEENPFRLYSEDYANGLDVASSLESMSNHDLETFDVFIKRKWDYWWSHSNEDARARAVERGATEEGADDETMETYVRAWNDHPPAIFMASIPTEWDEDGKPTAHVSALAKRKKVGESFTISVNGEEQQSNLDWYDTKEYFIAYVKNWIDANAAGDYKAENLPSLGKMIQGWKDDLKDLEKLKNEGVVKRESAVNDMTSDPSVAPQFTRGDFKDMKQAFLNIIDYAKKSGVQEQTMMEREDHWRIVTMLWSFSEAVRNGYSRMAIPSGAASGKRGGFTPSWWHADSIKFQLEKKEVRGVERDILIVKPNNVAEPMWIDVTDDRLAPMTPDRVISDTADPLEGYLSAAVTVQLGRDVAEHVALKLKRAEKAPSSGHLLISKQESTGHQDQIFETYFIHDTQGNIIDQATTEEEANAMRDEMKDKDVSPTGTLGGSVFKNELGGPIMLLKSAYVSYSGAFQLTGTDYQHTVTPSTLAGGRTNYDIVMPSRIRGHIKRFGLKIEEGKVKVNASSMDSAVLKEGGRQVYNMPTELVEQFPNIRLEEIQGENYGWIINSDKGVVMPTVFPHQEAAETAYENWIDQHSVPEDGVVKVMQVTFNDKLIEYHKRPINPYLNVSYQLGGNKDLQDALDKIGRTEEKLLDRFNAWRASWRSAFNTGVFDRFYGILHAMRITGQANVTAEDHAYIQARLSTGLESMMRGVMEFGHPVWSEGVVENEGKGLLKILEPIANEVESWAAYMAGKRSKRLLLEGYDKLGQAQKDQLTGMVEKFAGRTTKEKLWNWMIDQSEKTAAENDLIESITFQGRESLFTIPQIEALVSLEQDFPIFNEVAADYAEFNKKMLDFAEASGVVNAETRPLWENADYIPFYRIADDRLVGPLQKGVGIVDQHSPIKTLKGGTANLGDLVHNIFMNLTNLMDASVKNNAALKAIDLLEPTGIIQKQAHEFSKELIPMSEVGRVLKVHGMDVGKMPEEVARGLQVMFAVQPPQGEGVISVLRDGKKEFYHTEDELLYRSLTALNMKAFGAWMNLFRAPKRLLTSWVTLDPGFMIANFVRDSMSAFVLSRDNFIPLYHGLTGFHNAITEGDTMRAMIGSGAAFDSGYINQGDPKATKRLINKAMKDAGFQRTLLNTPRKLLEAWKRIGSATENANRIAVYEAAIKAGKSKAQAAYESKDLMDFSMGGDWPFIQILIQTVPFMGARAQGLQRLGRGAAEHPVAFLVKGSLIGMAGIALWAAFRDDERYKELEDWDKDTYFHWWIGDQHYRLPKGFEVGALFNTVPERIMDYYYSKENDAGKFLIRRFGFMMAETFNMNPIPQTARPLIESLANYNFFTGRSIESPWEEQKLPQDRYRYYTSPTMIELAATLPEGMTTVLNGKLTSPLQLQNIYRGYTGTLGRYFLMAADSLLRETGNYAIPPERTIADYPVIGRFARGDAPRRTRYEQEFYNELRAVNMAMNSLADADKQENDPRMLEIKKLYGPQIESALDFQNFSREIRQLNKEVRLIYQDNNKSPQMKRKEIDKIQMEKNEIFKEAYDNRPSAKKKTEDLNINTLIDGFDPGAPDSHTALKNEAPHTAQLLQDVSGMSQSNLDKLARAANYEPRS